MSTQRTIYRDQAVSPGTSEYLDLTVTSKPVAPGEDAMDLDTTVQFTFDRVTYWAAAWAGTQTTNGSNKARVAQLLMTDANLPLANTVNTIYVRITDNPEAPIVKAGTLTVR